jgi:hypothetical protein
VQAHHSVFFSRMRFAFTLGISPPANPITSRRPFQAMHFSDLSKTSPPTGS